MFYRHIALLLMFIAIGYVPPVFAEGAQCHEVTSLPAVITEPGNYCLKQNLNMSDDFGAAIRVHADNVVLDCNHHMIDGLSGGPDAITWGITSNGTRLHMTIRNCRIRGFQVGIDLPGAGYFLLENNRLEKNTWQGIYIASENSTVRNNQIYDTGSEVGEPGVAGILAVGAVNIINNVVHVVNAPINKQSNAYGISISGTGEISDNHIAELKASIYGKEYGIIAENGRVSIKNNTLISDGSYYGIVCNDDSSISRDNVTNGFITSGYCNSFFDTNN